MHPPLGLKNSFYPKKIRTHQAPLQLTTNSEPTRNARAPTSPLSINLGKCQFEFEFKSTTPPKYQPAGLRYKEYRGNARE